MSDANVQIAKRWIDAYNSRDLDSFVALDDDDFEFRSIFVEVESVFRGHERFPHAYFETLDDAYESFVVVPSEFIDAGAAVLMVAKARWRGRNSGAEGETPIATAFWLRSGRIFRAETFTEREKAFEAVGLKEEDLREQE